MRESQEKALQAALVECQRFVRAAKKALEKHHEDEEYNRRVEQCRAEGYDVYDGPYPKDVAASLASTKRASMDLTRALARFRRA